MVPSVTTVLKSEAKPAIAQWVADQTAAYAVANLDQLHRMSEDRGFRFLRWYHSRTPKLTAETDINNYHEGVLNDAADLGTAIHEWVQAEVTGITPYPDTTDQPPQFWEMVEAWAEFAKGKEIVPHFTETTVWNDELGYAGTADGVWMIDGRYTLLDLKTSRGLYSSTWMQLAALWNAPELLHLGEDGIDASIREWQAPVQDVAVIHIRPSDWDSKGTYMEPFVKYVPVPSIEAHWAGFQGLLTYTHAMRQARLEENDRKKNDK